MILTKRQAFTELSKVYPSLKESEKSDLSRICNKLLQVNFITAQKKRDYNDFQFILGFKEVFEPLLALFDFELVIKREYQLAYIINESGYNRLQLKKNESVIILIIRMLYQYQKEKVSIHDDIEIQLLDIHKYLEKIGYNDRLNKNELKPILIMLRRYNIIDYLDDGLRDECRIKIYPTILFVTNVDNMKAVLNQLDSYVSGIPYKEEDSGGKPNEETI